MKEEIVKLKARKHKLEKDIQKLIDEFQIDNELRIAEINLDHFYSSDKVESSVTVTITFNI